MRGDKAALAVRYQMHGCAAGGSEFVDQPRGIAGGGQTPVEGPVVHAVAGCAQAPTQAQINEGQHLGRHVVRGLG